MDYLFALQNIRESAPEIINWIFLIISEVFLKGSVVFVAIIYWSLNKSAGIKIAMGYSCAYSINQTIKNIACVPRPWILDSRLKVDSLAEGGATGYSFPSGHTVTAASVFGGVAAWQKKRPFIVVLMAIFTLLV
ncbi:MAG: phosphatase PAP2 family protein, partial [Treponema sp.]|nr:phosphatase PAP2 family protein [Treponema sp.]